MKRTRFSPYELRVLGHMPDVGPVTYNDLESTTGLRRAELVVTLAQLVVGRHVEAWQEGHGTQVTRWYRKLAPEEQHAPTVVEYDAAKAHQWPMRQRAVSLRESVDYDSFN